MQLWREGDLSFADEISNGCNDWTEPICNKELFWGSPTWVQELKHAFPDCKQKTRSEVEQPGLEPVLI